MAHELVIISPEKTVLTYRLSGIGSRALAHIFDLVILFAILIGLTLLISLLVGFSFMTVGGGVGNGVASIALGILFSLGPFLYFILFEWLWNGQTLGKKALGIRVRMADGTPITFAAALSRN